MTAAIHKRRHQLSKKTPWRSSRALSRRLTMNRGLLPAAAEADAEETEHEKEGASRLRHVGDDVVGSATIGGNATVKTDAKAKGAVVDAGEGTDDGATGEAEELPFVTQGKAAQAIRIGDDERGGRSEIE